MGVLKNTLIESARECNRIYLQIYSINYLIESARECNNRLYLQQKPMAIETFHFATLLGSRI